jgi:hypothetical protein
MAVCTAGFEAGINGNTISTGDAGNTSPWDGVQITSPGTLKYSSAKVYNGSLSMECVPSTAANGIHAAWSTSLGTPTDHYGRLYCLFTATPSNSTPRIVATESGGQNAAQIRVNSSGQFTLLDGLNTVQATSTVVVVPNQWHRIEWHFIHSVTVGQMELKMFLTPESTTPNEILTTAADKNIRANMDGIRFGLTFSAPSGYGATVYFDNIVANATSYPGPAVVATYNTISMLGRGSA